MSREPPPPDTTSTAGRLPPTRAADYVRQAALALHHAHKHGLVHRDVKPSNLLLGAEGRIKLLDLGLARFLQDQIGDSTLTQEGTGMGTPDYCSPEQFRDAHKADARSDIYSLGCTLYHLIAGKPPFPGSSLSEKVKAHETREPQPVEEFCPEVPGGLTLTLKRMLAKRPADRFANMGEVVAALAPYVAGASPSFRDLRNTATWNGSQLATMPVIGRRLAVPWLLAAASMLLALGAFIALAASLKRGGEGEVAQPNSSSQSDASDEEGASASRKAEPRRVEGTHDPNLLTVSKDAKIGGRFRTLREAVDAVVRPNMTIRVLDNAEYTEPVMVVGVARAGLTLEAPAHATLIVSTPNSYCVAIDQVPRVTVRGFRLRVDKPSAGVGLGGSCPGTVLEDLKISSATGQATAGIRVEYMPLEAEDPPILIQDCSIHNCVNGIIVLGLHAQSRQSRPSRRIVARRNRIRDLSRGILLKGSLEKVQVTGNFVFGCTQAGLQIEDPSPSLRHVLLANNTICDCAEMGFRLLENKTARKHTVGQVELCNNLLFACRVVDMAYLIYSENQGEGGDVKELMKTWQFRGNARDMFGSRPELQIPRAETDHPLTNSDLVSMDLQKMDSIRPAPKSPLTMLGITSGPGLPAYVGAQPPEGVEPWDWARTWRTRMRPSEK